MDCSTRTIEVKFWATGQIGIEYNPLSAETIVYQKCCERLWVRDFDQIRMTIRVVKEINRERYLHETACSLCLHIKRVARATNLCRSAKDFRGLHVVSLERFTIFLVFSKDQIHAIGNVAYLNKIFQVTQLVNIVLGLCWEVLRLRMICTLRVFAVVILRADSL